MACLADTILRWFRGRSDTIAVADDGKSFRPVKLNTPLKPEWLQVRHLTGQQCLGFYVLTEDSRCWCTCVDVDSHNDENPDWQDDVEAIYYALAQLLSDKQILVEVSASGQGAHVWLVFDKPVEAYIVRRFWEALRNKRGLLFNEIYPRQDCLTSERPLGNLIRYPYYRNSKFVSVEEDWKEVHLDELDVQPSDGDELKRLAYELTGEIPKPTETVAVMGEFECGISPRVQALIDDKGTAFSSRWHGDTRGLMDTSRSAIIMSLIYDAIDHYVPTSEVKAMVRAYCKMHDYSKGDRDGWVELSVRKGYELKWRKNDGKPSSGITVVKAMQEYAASLAHQEANLIPSGLDPLDASIGGIRYGEMAIIAARPSQGKSAFGIAWAEHAAGIGIPSLIISEEMGSLEIGRRNLKRISDVPEDSWEGMESELHATAESFWKNRAPIYIAESCGTVDKAVEVVEQYVSSHGVRFIVIDYLQLLGVKGMTGRYEIVTEVSQQIRKLTRRHNIAAITLCQLNRGIENREELSPKLSDLRESGQIEQDADLVLFLVWPFKFGIEEHGREFYQIFCAKRRTGPIREPVVNVAYDPDRQVFYDPAVHTEFTQFA